MQGDWLSMDRVQAVMRDFERRFPRKTIAGKLVMRQSTADVIRRYCRVANPTSFNPLLMPFEGVACEIDEEMAAGEVRVLNLDGEVIQVIIL